MNRDDIIRMVWESGGDNDDPSNLLTIGNLERFAALVAAAERDACIKDCEQEVSYCRAGSKEFYGALNCLVAIKSRKQ